MNSKYFQTLPRTCTDPEDRLFIGRLMVTYALSPCPTRTTGSEACESTFTIDYYSNTILNQYTCLNDSLMTYILKVLFYLLVIRSHEKMVR